MQLAVLSLDLTRVCDCCIGWRRTNTTEKRAWEHALCLFGFTTHNPNHEQLVTC